MTLADFHRNDTGMCFPSAILIAELCRCNEKSVRRALTELEKQGFISLKRRNRQPPLVSFNWGRPGTFNWKNRTTDTESVDGFHPSYSPDAATPTKGQFGATDRESVDSEINPNDGESTDFASHHLRTFETESTDILNKSTDTESGEPGNLVITREEPDAHQSIYEIWEPSKLVVDAIRSRFGPGFRIPEHWILEFRVYAHGRDLTSSNIDKAFLKWAPLQRAEEKRLDIAQVNERPGSKRIRGDSSLGLDREMTVAEMLELTPIGKAIHEH